MTHGGKGESAKKDRKKRSKRHRVTFQLDTLEYGSHRVNNEARKVKGETDAVREFSGNGQERQSDEHAMDFGVRESHDPEGRLSKDAPRELRCACEQSSPNSSSRYRKPSNAPRFQRSTLLKALKRSGETFGYIENEKKRILLSLEHKRRQYHECIAKLSTPRKQSNGRVEHTDENSAVLHRRCVRLKCEQSATDLISQRLPLTMMSFVEESLNTAHFVKRRRAENGHGRIIHKILLDQHMQLMKLREEHNDRYGTDSSSTLKRSESEPNT
mmetsp:Transcript_11315/g.26654  ORF Transcript_11315/g.26654 Transcript_11315/m.26654 type:complete len:271 (+) Transcript_11315:134-946(+)